MTHRRLVPLLVPLVLVIVLLPGCWVRVTEPLSDPDKAEPDEGLLGKWSDDLEIDIPAVKGNPKWLMRAKESRKEVNETDRNFWFFTTKIGKHTYMTFYVEALGDSTPADFSKEGAFKEWNEKKDRAYCIYRYVLDRDKLTVDGGSEVAVKKLMQVEGIGQSERTGYFKTPKDWLAKYLKESGPETIYDGTNVQELRRAKK